MVRSRLCYNRAMATSESHPIRVDWLPLPWRGRVGLTFAPGKHADSYMGFRWTRDLDMDLARLRSRVRRNPPGHPD